MELVPDTGSRKNGAKLRALILLALSKHDKICINFDNTILTPSFADEAIGRLSQSITLIQFKQQIRFSQVSRQHKALLLKVIANRFSCRARDNM